jgi:chemotaxis protein methyltransferase CheR
LGVKRVILGVSDIKNLFQVVNAKYSLDFSNYALSSLKRRVEKFMGNYFITNIDELINRLDKDGNFFELFLQTILVDDTEMFRDPEFWFEFKNNVLKKYRYATEIKIWVPDINSGDELYSLQIILEQLNLAEKTSIYASTMSGLNIEKINRASFDQKKMEINVANFERFEEGANLNEYFQQQGNVSFLNSTFNSKLTVEKHNLFIEKPISVFDIVLFRNKMLYYNPQLRIDALKILTSAIRPGGYLVVGIKEMIDYPSWENDYVVLNESEKIFKKILK